MTSQVCLAGMVLARVMVLSVQDPIKTTIYYESFSRESAEFIVKQLYKVWAEFSPYIQLRMVPIAVIQQSYHDGHMQLTCRGGPKECQTDALHACAFHLACKGLEEINCPEDFMDSALEYIKCMVQSKGRDANKACATNGRLSSAELAACATGWVGETLQSHYANLTIGDIPLYRMELPHIVIDTYVDYPQDYARTNLRSLLCGLLPDVCWDSLECRKFF